MVPCPGRRRCNLPSKGGNIFLTTALSPRSQAPSQLCCEAPGRLLGGKRNRTAGLEMGQGSGRATGGTWETNPGAAALGCEGKAELRTKERLRGRGDGRGGAAEGRKGERERGCSGRKERGAQGGRGRAERRRQGERELRRCASFMQTRPSAKAGPRGHSYPTFSCFPPGTLRFSPLMADSPWSLHAPLGPAHGKGVYCNATP